MKFNHNWPFDCCQYMWLLKMKPLHERKTQLKMSQLFVIMSLKSNLFNSTTSEFWKKLVEIIIWRTCGFNKTIPHAIKQAKQFNDCNNHCPVVLFHVLVTKISRLDLVIWLIYFLCGKSQIFVNKLHAASVKYRNIYENRLWKI